MIFVLLTSVAAPGGTPFSLYESNADPNGNLTPVAGPGAVCIRNDAGSVSLYLNTATNVWMNLGGALGPLYPDDVPATWGTTDPAQGTIVYSSANARWELSTDDISAVAATQQTRPILLESGIRTTTDANAGQVSGAVTLRSGATVQTGAAAGGLSGAFSAGSGTATQSAAGVGAGSGTATFASGATDSTVAGGTGGPSGAVTVGSGAATSTAGTSGATGITTLQSGASDDANTGAVNVQSGNAAGAGAVVSGTVTVRSGTVGGTGTTGNVALVSGAPVGAGISGNVTGTTGNVAGAGTTGSIVLTTGNAAGAGTSGSIRLVVGTTVGGTLGTIDFQAATLTTTTQATQLQIIDANAAALQIGAAGALNMLVFDTTNAAEEMVVNAANGLRAVDNVGFWIGTLTADRFQYRYDLANNRGTLAGTAVTAAGAAAVTRPFRTVTGAAVVNNAAAGGNSGTLDFLTGLTDATLGGGTGGNTGAINFTTGPANQTAGTGGNTGGMAFATGNAAAVGGGVTSGGYTFTTGTVGGTGTTGGYTLTSGAPVGAGTSGGFSFTSGNVAGAGISGGATLQSGTTATGTTGNVSLVSGNATGAGTSGNVVLTTGTVVGGTRGVVDINSATVDLVTQATQLQLIDANAAALSIGAAGALNMLVFDTTNAAEELTVNAVNGIRAVDNVGHWIGTLTADRFQYRYDLVNTRGTIAGTAVTAAGALAVTRSFRIVTGAATVNDAAIGSSSGSVDILTGATDASAGGGTAGPTGPATITTGSSTATGGGTAGGTGVVQITTGNTTNAASGTGAIQLVTGNATAGAGPSGNIVLTTGTSAGGARGVLDINVPIVDLVTQATFLDLIDNNGSALIFRAGASGLTILTVDTTNAAETFAFATIVTTNDGVAGSNARRVGGSILRTVAESVAVTGAEAAFAGGAVTVDNTPNVATKVGTRIAFSALVRVAAVSGGPTAQIRIRIGAAGVGGTLAFDTTARTVADEDIISLEGYLDVRATGAPGTATGVCRYYISAADALSSAAASEWGQDVAGSVAGTWTVAITTTADVDVTITGQTDGAGTDLQLESFRVWLEA